MSDWRYSDATQRVVTRVRDDGVMESQLVGNPDVRAWIALGNAPGVSPDPPRRMVRKSLIIDRLNAAGKLAAASAALNASIYTRERWYAPDRPAVYADDPEALALLAAIGADAAVIMAPE